MPKYSIPVWNMVSSVFHNTKEFLTIKEIRERVHSKYPKENVNNMTIRLQTIFHCINHPGKKNDVSNRWQRNPLFSFDGEDKFRLLTEKEREKCLKTSQ